MFAPAGINIDAILTDPHYQLNTDDQSTDLDKIVSHEGTPQSGDTAALYSYVATEEAKGGTSPRRNSDGHSHNRRTKSTQNTPSPRSLAIHAEGQEHTFPVYQRQEDQINPNTHVFKPQHQHSNSQPTTQPRTQGFDQQNFGGARNFRQQSSIAIGASNFIPLGIAPEGYETQTPAAEVLYRTMSGPTSGDMQTVDAFGNINGLVGTEIEVDGMNFWWDQSYVTFDIEVNDPNTRVGGGAYQSGDFSFGY